jgi:hypothetical protein
MTSKQTHAPVAAAVAPEKMEAAPEAHDVSKEKESKLEECRGILQRHFGSVEMVDALENFIRAIK